MLARGSLRFIIPPLVLGGVLLFVFVWLGIGFILLGLYFAWFFRDPNRSVQPDDSVLYAVADGKVKQIHDQDGELKIAVRMSPFDVHLNRAPISATITDIIYQPGEHRNVYFGGAEEKNERNLISMETGDMEIDILQITGAFARRLECWVGIDDTVDQGEKIGIIRFGSQTNIVARPFDPEKYTLVPIVNVDQQVYAGSTPIIRIRSNGHE